MSRASDISATAAQWLIRLEGQTTPAIWDEFQTWVDADPRHRAAFVRLREAWHKSDTLKCLRPADGTIDADLLASNRLPLSHLTEGGQRPVELTPRRRLEDRFMPDRRRVLMTAGAIAATGVLAWMGSYHLGWKTYATGVGGREKVQLADGTIVDLNTNTELTVHLMNGRRDITLNRGEALFHVAHDPLRPFYVTANGTVVRAVGTAFCVRIRDAEHVDVLVSEGRVAVGAPGGDSNFENPHRLLLAPKASAGEIAVVQGGDVQILRIAEPDLTRKLAWTAGHLAFQGETLDHAVEEFNRYNQRRLQISDPTIMKIKVGGSFMTTDPDSFVAALHRTHGIQVEVNNKGDMLLSAAIKPP